MNIYLYIKQHTITGKLYFGKTTKNPEKYLGSGLHWSRHIKQHGKEYVVNLWYHLFENQEDCTNFALEFSSKMNIVESDQWLNLKPENGLDGAIKGNPGTFLNKHHSNETKNKMSTVKLGKAFSEEHKYNLSKAKLGSTISNETKQKISEYQIHRIRSEESKQKLSKTQTGKKRGPYKK